MNELMERLLGLQTLDVEISTLAARERDLPAQVQAAERRVAAKETDLQNTRERAKKAKEGSRLKELDLASLEEKLNKLKIQLLGARDNKEYGAFRREIEDLEASVSATEDAILASLDQVDALTQRCREIESEIEKGRVDVEAHRDVLRKELEQVQAELGRKRQDREGFVAQIDGVQLSKYDRLLKRYKGETVVPVRGDQSCSGCRLSLPKQVLVELFDERDLVTCPGCGRILYLGEGVAAADV